MGAMTVSVAARVPDGGVAQAGDPGQPINGTDRVDTRTGDHAAVPNQSQFGEAACLGDNVHGFDERGRSAVLPPENKWLGTREHLWRH